MFESNTATPLANYAEELGELVASRLGAGLTDILRPLNRQDAKKRSLSEVFGLGAFPFHTDLAHILIPPRYVLLRHIGSCEHVRPTLLKSKDDFDFSSSDQRTLRQAVWIVNGGRGRFLSPILNPNVVPNKEIIRFDPVCMRPAHESFSKAKTILDSVCSIGITEISWKPSQVLVVDNWRVLHARANQGNYEDQHRVLERCLVSG